MHFTHFFRQTYNTNKIPKNPPLFFALFYIFVLYNFLHFFIFFGVFLNFWEKRRKTYNTNHLRVVI